MAMQVDLIHHDEDALDILLFSKQTRLTMTPGLLEEIKAWPYERKMEELDYMLKTIQSSWEFPSYTFLIDGVTRAFTHQLVRTRTGSYAQQSQRTVPMEGFTYTATGELHLPEDYWDNEVHAANLAGERYDFAMTRINAEYQGLLSLGVPPQDARGLLPTNIHTNIMAKFDLRTLSGMAKTRLCYRTQGEYQKVFSIMRALVVGVHPWAEPFLRVACAATGVCQFPNFTDCPIQGGTFNPETGGRFDEVDARPLTKSEIQELWQITTYEARPKVAKKT
jgi:flavin-dependent thymidylate synthase